MAITVLSLGFLARSDVELACGSNMVMRTQMDYLAESGLEQARGLILSPQDLAGEWWAGAMGQQLTDGSNDFYDVAVVKLGGCNYKITSDAYRMAGGERIGRSSLLAELRLDDCIGLWLGSGATISDGMTIDADVYCNGILVNSGVINGDVFAQSLRGSVLGQRKTVGELSLEWPGTTASAYTSHYAVQSVGASLSGVTYGPYEPVRICHHSGDLVLNGSVVIDGMLIVEGDMVIHGSGNILRGGKNLPAFFVTGDVVVESGGELDVQGLGVIEGQMQLGGGAAVNIVGGLFTKGGLKEVTPDSSGNDNVGVLYGGLSRHPNEGQISGAFEFDGADDYVQTVDDSSKLQLTSDYTLAVWIKADAVQNTWAGIFSKCSGSGEDSVNHWTLQFNSTSTGNIVVHHPASFWDTKINLSDIAGGWHHIRIVRRAGLMTSYLDGSERVHSDNSFSENPGSGLGHFNIGADRTASSNYMFKGLLDDIRVYDRAPDANETYPSSGLIGHWELDDADPSMQITADASKTAILFWDAGGTAHKWSQAAGGFFRSIERIEH